MAINLKKGDEENKKSLNLEKKNQGINLNKSEEMPKVKINLVKEDNSNKQANLGSLDTNKAKKKQSVPMLWIGLIGLVLIGVVTYFLAQNNPDINDQGKSSSLATPDVNLNNNNTVNENVQDTVVNSSKKDLGTDQNVSGDVKAQSNSQEAEKELKKDRNNKLNNDPALSSRSNKMASDSKNNLNNDLRNKVQVNSSMDGIEQKAQDVLRGRYGNGADRKSALGAEYTTVQALVNKIIRERD
jgi:hypothetical protein